MNYQFVFSTPTNIKQYKQPKLLPQSQITAHTRDHEDQTRRKAQHNKKFMKIYSRSSENPTNYKKLELLANQNRFGQANLLQKQGESSFRKICVCFDDCKNEENIDFGVSNKRREISPDKAKKGGKIDTPVNELIELQEQHNPYPTHYLRKGR